MKPNTSVNLHKKLSTVAYKNMNFCTILGTPLDEMTQPSILLGGKKVLKWYHKMNCAIQIYE